MFASAADDHGNLDHMNAFECQVEEHFLGIGEGSRHVQVQGSVAGTGSETAGNVVKTMADYEADDEADEFIAQQPGQRHIGSF